MNYNLDFVDSWVKDALHKQVFLKRQEDRLLQVNALNGATILPMHFGLDSIKGGVVDATLHFIPNTGFHVGKEGEYLFSQQDVNICHKQAFYLGYFNKTWGHCFTDNIKLLWPFVYSQFDNLLSKKNMDFIYLCDDGFKLSKSFMELLQLIGIDVNRMKPIYQLTQYETLYVADACFYTKGEEERFYTKEYTKLIHSITDKITPIKEDKIYLTRTALKHGRDIGEKDIETVFKRLGYKIISPEKLSLYTQLAYIKGCKILATTEGSISHNAVFMSRGTNVVIIRKCSFVNEYQIALNEINDLNVTYIDAHLSVFARQDVLTAGPFFLYVNDNMIRFSAIGGLQNTFSLNRFRQYVNTCILLPHLEQRVIQPLFYYKKASIEIERKKQEMRNFLNKVPLLPISAKRKIISLVKQCLK